ncbi:hypothetical protein DRO54_09195 [Candidatus Bathyarchaeota archaeon]|nr:MAG: hypothetical protein DRO54_09195 [Candidatus Bathyarchaeota archaeon]
MKAHNNTLAETLSSGEKKVESKIKIFKESFAVFLFNFGELLAGGLAVYFVSLVLAKRWVIMIYPLVLGVRGAINGVLSGRLSTGLHTKLIEPSLRKNTSYYYSILTSIYTLSLISSLTIGTLAFILSIIFYEIAIGEFALIIFSCIVTKAIALLITVPFTSLLGFLAYRRGLDPDVVVYPISSTVADIWATIAYIITLSMAFSFGLAGNIILYAIGLGFILTVLCLTYRFRKETEYWKTLKEAFFSVLIVGLIEAIGGFFLSRIKTQMERSPGILLVYPALMATTGSAGAIFGSISTTKLVLGLTQPSFKGIRNELSDLTQIGAASFILYFIYSLAAYVSETTLTVFLIPLLCFFITFPAITLIAFSMAILTFVKGLDPDNFVIPFETALTDTLLTLTLTSLILTFY